MRYRFILIVIMARMLSIPAVSSGQPVLEVVPKPAHIKTLPGSYTISGQTIISVNENDTERQRLAFLFRDQVKAAGGPELKVMLRKTGEEVSGGIVFGQRSAKLTHSHEGYLLKITKEGIHLSASSGAGTFYGIQTIFQLMPPGPSTAAPAATSSGITLPCLEIKDFPRYAYRGMHLDVSRHFFPKEFIKKYIDLIAMYKMNVFHWHMTDDNGWRLEIKKYPRLTEISAWRADHEDKPWGQRPPQQPGEKATYGGFYTQEEVREIVKYAADRFITVIPEIEMPAHCVEVLAAYPHLSCTGGPFTVPTGSYWPNTDIFCAGNDSVFTFLQDVLAEVMELFPSKYIHAGGDEADKTNWSKCQKCQERIRKEGLKDEKELQSYFMKRMEQFIVSKNRKMIGWDEILEGGLAPEATVMSWRGVEGGIAAARQGHDAIMTPTSHCYFDYYQADPDFEPKAIGGFTTLKKVYSYDPTPAELTEKEARHILGAQGNVWTEFIPTASHAEYMAVPRMIALAEVVWTPQKDREWNDFRRRLKDQFHRLEKMNVNYSRGSFRVEVSTQFDQKDNAVKVVLSSEQPDLPIRYTLNGDNVTASSPEYKVPFEIRKNSIIRAGVFENGQLREKLTEMPLIFHHAIGKPVKYVSSYSYRYTAGGISALTDGLRGSANHRDGLWQGYLGNDLDLVIDLGSVQPVNSVQVNFLQNQRSWIFLPVMAEYSLSADGKKYHSFNEVTHSIPAKEGQVIIQPFNFQFMTGTKARYVHVKAKNLGICPDWHEGKGEACWMFVDEVVVF